MSFFKNRMVAAAAPIICDVAAKLGGGPRRDQTGGPVMAAALTPCRNTRANAERLKRVLASIEEDARKEAYLRAKAGPSNTPSNAERLKRVLAL